MSEPKASAGCWPRSRGRRGPKSRPSRTGLERCRLPSAGAGAV